MENPLLLSWQQMRGISAAAVTAVLQIPDLGVLLSDCHSPLFFFSVFVNVCFVRMEPPVSPIMTLYLVRQRVKFVCELYACVRTIKLSRCMSR